MKIQVLEAVVHRWVEFRSSPSAMSGKKRRVRSRSFRDLDIPASTRTFFFFDVAEIKIRIGRRIVTWSKLIEGTESAVYYYGEVYSWARLHREFPEERRILSAESSNRALHTLLGSWDILDPGDLVLNPRTRRIMKVR